MSPSTISLLKRLSFSTPVPESWLPAARHRDANPNTPAFDVRNGLYQVLGIDLTQFFGLGPYLVLKLISECGADMVAGPRSSTLPPG